VTIKEVLSSYYIDLDHALYDVYQPIQNMRLYADFATWALTDKTLNWLFKMLTKYGETSFHPDTVVELCSNMGFMTWEKLQAYMTAVNGTDFSGTALFEYQNPVIDVSRLTQKVTYQELYYILRINGIKIPVGAENFTEPDGYYLLPDDMVQEILDKFDSDKYPYVMDFPERRTCRHFSHMVKGTMARHGLSLAAVGIVSAEMMWDGEIKSAHSFLVMVNESREVYYADGQDDTKLWKPTEPVTGYSGIDEVGTVRLIEF